MTDDMDSAHPDLIWRQTSPGVWERSIDEVEQLYAALATLSEGSGLMFFAITGHVSLTIDIPQGLSSTEADPQVDQALRKAWLALRHDHPSIASRVDQDLTTGRWTKTYRHFPDEDAQKAWLDETLVMVPAQQQTGVEWANSQPPAPKLPTLFVLGPPSDKPGVVVRRDLVFRSPHDIIDGIGTLTLLNNFISHAARAYSQAGAYQLPTLDGSEAANLSPPYRVAADVPSAATESQQKRLAEMAAQKKSATESPGIEVLALPYRNHSTVLPGRHQRVAFTLPESQTASLLAACKAAGATVTHAFHAAIALVVRDIQARETDSERRPRRVCYVNYILRNERPSCRPPYNSPKHAAALYHSISGQSLVVDMDLPAEDDRNDDEEFLPIVHLIREFYHGVRNDAEHFALAPAIWAAITPPVPTGPRPLPVPPPKTHPSVSISSMGRVDGIVAPETGAFAAHDPWVTGEELGNGLGLFLGTFRGELCLSAAYNDAWHTEADVLDFLERCKAVVFRGFGIAPF